MERISQIALTPVQPVAYRVDSLRPSVGSPLRMQRSLNTDPILRLEAVKLTLMSQAGPVNILNGIELVIREGEAIGLVGPSGSGKSTMLMVMTGLERPTSGKVTVKSKELSAFSEDEAARFRRGNVGIVFQSFHLIPTMTALENVAVPLEIALVPNAFERAREELTAVGLEPSPRSLPKPALGRRAAARRARPRARAAPEPALRRRADRQSRRPHRRRNHRAHVQAPARARLDARSSSRTTKRSRKPLRPHRPPARRPHRSHRGRARRSGARPTSQSPPSANDQAHARRFALGAS